ncbi:MAG: ATP-binding protein [Oligoflexus sp.]
MSKVKTEIVAPGAKRLIQSLRGLGYAPETAIADLIDNSLAADATTIHVNISYSNGDTPAYIAISDNGTGMDREVMREAMRFGSKSSYSADDLGKYGLGLKTASLSQCAKLTVSSKLRPKKGRRPRRIFSRWDLDHVFAKDDWSLMFPDEDYLQDWEKEILEHSATKNGGTTVLWTDLSGQLSQLTASDVKVREKFLAHLLQTISDHLRSSFHLYMQGLVPGRRTVKIFVEGNPLEPWDPYCIEEDIWELEHYKPSPETFAVSSKSRVVFEPIILPARSEFSSEAKWRQAGLGNWSGRQGFYFYRNHRLIQAGGWNYLAKTNEPHYSLVRVAVMFNGDYDDKFSVNVTKMRARIPEEIRTELKNYTEVWRSEGKKRYDGKQNKPKISKKVGRSTQSTSTAPSVKLGAMTVKASNAQTGTITAGKGARPNELNLVIPQNHPISSLFDKKTGELERFCLAMFGLLEALAHGKLNPKQVPLDSLRKKLKSIL